MMEIKSESSSSSSFETPPNYVNPDQMFDKNNIRLRHIKSNLPIQRTVSQPGDFILSTGDFLLNEKENDLQSLSPNKHNKIQIIFLIFTALSYLLYTIRFYISEYIQISSHFWSSIESFPITRVYTLELRPNLIIENFLLRSTEICQTFWLIYILSFIPRHTHIGYLYRNPNIFNSSFCSLLLSTLVFQIISQTSIPPEISSACLLISFILLIISSRLIAIKLLQYEEKLKSIDRIFIRYFILNSLFLYTISIGYLTICSSIESIAFHLDLDIKMITTIGFSIVLSILIIYFILDQFIYKNEFQSIWTPYLFLGIAFHCPLFRDLFTNETNLINDDLNFYFLWIIFILIILLILIRLIQQISVKYYERKKKFLYKSSLEEKSLETENS